MSAHTCFNLHCTDAAALKVGDLQLCGKHYKQHTGWTR